MKVVPKLIAVGAVGLVMLEGASGDVIEKSSKIFFREKLSLPGGAPSRCSSSRSSVSGYNTPASSHVLFDAEHRD